MSFSLETKAKFTAEYIQSFEQPYGGPDWPQKSGYEIRVFIVENLSDVIIRMAEK